MVEENKKHEEKKEHKKEEHKEAPKVHEHHAKGKEFIVPLRRRFKKAVSYQKTPKAIKAIKEFMVRHMKVYDKDLSKIKIDKYLNEFMWTRGIKNPPSKIKVIAVREGEFIRVEMAELPERLGFKKKRMEKREASVKPVAKTPEVPHTAEQTEEKKDEEKEKRAAVVEAGHQMEKAAAKKMKHETKQPKQPKASPRRMSLKK